MIEVKSTLNGNAGEIDENKAYMVDFSRLQSVNDLMIVFRNYIKIVACPCF